MVEGATSPQVFISYSHDSQGHRANVLDLAQELRRAGMDAWVDQFIESDPPLSWPRWMDDEIERADFVLVVVTETYTRRFRGREEPNRGLGVRWEGAIITAELYRGSDDRVKFIPTLVDRADARHIPSPMALTTHHYVGQPENRDLTALLRQLRRLPVVVPEELGAAAEMPSTKGGQTPNLDVRPEIAAARAASNAGDMSDTLTQ